MARPLVVANCSGFYGDRLSAMREVLTGGPVDVVTGDYLAELTMLILGRQRMQDPDGGWARTFLTQLEECLGLVHAGGVRVVTNAGGLNPRGLAEQVRALAERLGVPLRVASVDGDDLMPRYAELRASGLLTADDGAEPADDVLTANAYLGAWGIVRALEAGADVVVTGRVTDASVVVGPAAWHHGWTRLDLDALAGATVAGHVLECGTQATGGNYSLFADLPDGALDRPGFPLAEVSEDGSCVVTKHPGTGGAVTVGTVTEQLLYELTGASYGGPDVVTRFDTLEIADAGPDRVRLSGARGLPPDGRLKVATNRVGGWRNGMVLPLVGLDVERKAEVLRRQIAPVLEGVEEVSVTLARTDHADAGVEEEAAALLRIGVKDPDRTRVAKAFTAPLIELGLASIPGWFPTAAPADPTPYGVYAPAWLPAAEAPARVVLPDGTEEEVPTPASPPSPAFVPTPVAGPAPWPPGPTTRLPLGTLVGARSGDKGGTCTLGVYARNDDAYRWLAATLTPDRLGELLPEAAALPVTRELLPSLRAVLFQLPGLLGQGVAAGTRFDPQGKAVGEWLRSRVVEIPVSLLPGGSPPVRPTG